MRHTPYVQFEDGNYTGHPIKRVGCMKCNSTIGSKDEKGNLYYWTHKRDIKVGLSDGSIAYIPVCDACHSIPTTQDDLNLFENSIKHGWLLEQTWAFKRKLRDQNSLNRAAQRARNTFVVMRGH